MPSAQRSMPPAYHTAVEEKQTYAPVKARWTSGSSAVSPTSAQSEQSGSSTVPAQSVNANGLQPADPEEEKKKQDKIKKLGGKVGTAAAGG